jgi:uncharacterized protein (DUF983 family)
MKEETPEASPMKEVGPAASEGSAGRCPFCGAQRSEPVNDFGPSLMTSVRHCVACGADFETVRWG